VHIERLKGETARDFVWQSSPIEGEVVAAIRYTRLEEYGQFVEVFVEEKYADVALAVCPSCGVQAVFSSVCEACFERLELVRCPETGEEDYFASLDIYAGVRVECPHCGGTRVP